MNNRSAETGYRFEKYRDAESQVRLPEVVEGIPLTTIGAKAFLSCRSVERLELPDSLEKVEDWAFAHMKGLQEIIFPVREIEFGKKVFLGCNALKQIVLRGAKKPYQGISFFLASAATVLEEVPLQLALAGDETGQWSWLREYDRYLEQYLRRSDVHGFEPAFIGWFHVEDVDDQQVSYVREQRRKKVKLAFERLMYPEGMTEELERNLAAYLLGRQDGAVPGMVLEMFQQKEAGYGESVLYFKIWQKIGGFQVYSPEFLLESLPDADPEVRAYLVESRLNIVDAGSFFENLEL